MKGKIKIITVFLIILIVILILLGGLFIYKNFISSEIIKGKDFSNWDDICVESVKPIDVGYVRPFWPFSPDSEWIAYNNIPPETEIKRAESEGVYLIRYDGSDKHLLAEEGYRPSFGRYQWQVIYSKEGKTGAPGPKGQGLEHDIWMINTDGTDEIQLMATKQPEVMKIWGGTPLTYDGKKIIYMTYDQGIWLINADGTNPRQIINYSGAAAGFSPNGQKLFTVSEQIKKGYLLGGFIELDNPEKAEWLTEIKFPENDYTHLSISLDGKMATFDNPRWENRNIWIMKLDGSNEHIQLTNHRGKFGEKGVVWANHPRFSPDGKWLVYDEQTPSEKGMIKNKVMIINIETKEKKEIYDGIIPDHCGMMEPGWSPDGKKIIFYAPDPNQNDQPSVWLAVLKECGK